MRIIGIFLHQLNLLFRKIGYIFFSASISRPFSAAHLDFFRPQCYYFLRNPKNLPMRGERL